MKKYQRRSQSEWKSLVAQQLDSGLSAPVFCKAQMISYPSFISWKKKLTQSESLCSEPTAFVEITPADIDSSVARSAAQSHPAPACIEVDIGAVMQLRIYSH